MTQTTAGNNKGGEEAVLTVRLMEFTLYEENKTFHKKILVFRCLMLQGSYFIIRVLPGWSDISPRCL